MGTITVIHDLPEQEILRITASLSETVYAFSALPDVNYCVGCFACWTKTPGICIIKDRHQELPLKMVECDSLVIISRCVYGCYSPVVKKVLDRCIGYIQPFFYINKALDEMHHVPRYPEQKKLQVYFYDVKEDNFQQTAQQLVAANAVNMNMKMEPVGFYSSASDIPLFSDNINDREVAL